MQVVIGGAVVDFCAKVKEENIKVTWALREPFDEYLLAQFKFISYVQWHRCVYVQR